mmetsp:Transcript_23383/g.73197  ORF Transcript_23383/g.73197 Transcript_23383/m.73197 type:complete len:315 (+) Transcript_23383:2358-3302(+)
MGRGGARARGGAARGPPHHFCRPRVRQRHQLRGGRHPGVLRQDDVPRGPAHGVVRAHHCPRHLPRELRARGHEQGRRAQVPRGADAAHGAHYPAHVRARLVQPPQEGGQRAHRRLPRDPRAGREPADVGAVPDGPDHLHPQGDHQGRGAQEGQEGRGAGEAAQGDGRARVRGRPVHGLARHVPREPAWVVAGGHAHLRRRRGRAHPRRALQGPPGRRAWGEEAQVPRYALRQVQEGRGRRDGAARAAGAPALLRGRCARREQGLHHACPRHRRLHRAPQHRPGGRGRPGLGGGAGRHPGRSRRGSRHRRRPRVG